MRRYAIRTLTTVALFITSLSHVAVYGFQATDPTNRSASKHSSPEDPSSLPLLTESEDFEKQVVSIAVNGVTPLQATSGDGTFWAVRHDGDGHPKLEFYREKVWTAVDVPRESVGDHLESIRTIQPGAEDYLLIGPNPRDLVLLKGSHVIACGEITEMIEWHSDAFCKAFGPGVPIIAPAFGNRQAWEVDIVSNEKEVWLVKAGLPRTLHIYTDGTWISAQETFARLSRDSGGTIYLWPGPRHEYICAIDPYHDDSQLYLASLDDNGELQAELLPRPRFFRGSKFVREGDEATWTSPGQSVVQRLDKDGNVARFTRRGIVSLCDQKGNLWFTYPYGTTTADVSVREVKKNQEGEVELATVKTIELPGVRTLEVEQLPDGSYLAAIRLPSSNYEEDRESYEALLWFTLDEHLDIKDSKQYLISRTPQRSVSINASWSYNPQGFLVVYAPSTERDVRDCTILTPQR